MKTHLWIASAMLSLLAATAGAQQAPRESYIVQLADLPAAAYTGTVAGYAATKPAPGQKFDQRAARVLAYRNFLGSRQSAVLAGLGNVPVTHRYSVAFNGFTAQLTAGEVARLKANPSVVAVRADKARTLNTSRTPAFLGLTGPGGLHTNNVLGENIIVGIIDGGITPENPSFSDKVDPTGKPVSAHLPGTVVYGPIGDSRTWNGTCATGPGFPAGSCNNKLIGARFYHAGFDRVLVRQPVEFLSPRDADGHGSHTASTAAGNAGVASVVNGLAAGTLSGVAPRARIAAYKVCWLYQGSALATCFDSDAVSAIDQAVADGVDVLNFSIGGPSTDFLDSVEVAFLFAADAGVFVAASAGNSGPGNTLEHLGPWLTTVGASTHDRLSAATVTLGNGASYSGPSAQVSGLPSRPLILADEAGINPVASLTALQAAALRRCFSAGDLADASLLGAAAGPAAALDPAKVAGKIVVCDRGSNNRVNKSLATREAGGVGTIVVNTGANTLNDDSHFVPTVHLSHTFRAEIRAYAAGGAGTASFAPSSLVAGVVAPVMAAFSSRGPNLGNANILKPDITAPGVSVLAAYAPPLADAATTSAAIAAGNYPAPAFEFLQGTSMSSPHIAGMAALLKQARPGWSPAAIKSALMTSATPVKLPSGAVDTDHFGYGAGHGNPNGAAATNLVYDAGFPDYAAFLCGIGSLNPTGTICNTFGFLAPWNLNLASLTAEVVGVQTLQRTVTNVGNSPATYTASLSAPGFDVTVTPQTLSLAPNASGSFTVRVARTTAPLNTWMFGQLSWSDGSQTVRSPLTLMPLAVVAPSLVEDTRSRGNRVFTLGAGYTGALRASNTGLVPATRIPGAVAIGSRSCRAPLSVAAGTAALRVALFNADTAGNGRDDIDLEVYFGSVTADTQVGSSGGASSNELVDLSNPPAGNYIVCVVGFGTARAGVTQLDYTLSRWVVAPGQGLANSLRVSVPANVVMTGTGTGAMSWAVPTGQRYYAAVDYFDGANTALGRSMVYIDNVSTVLPAAGAAGSKDMLKKMAAAAR